MPKVLENMHQRIYHIILKVPKDMPREFTTQCRKCTRTSTREFTTQYRMCPRTSTREFTHNTKYAQGQCQKIYNSKNKHQRVHTQCQICPRTMPEDLQCQGQTPKICNAEMPKDKH
ncbi:hypothetical protein F8M41_012937 [Gigaspora margarita]|uniref:Uncharacterized protein n=1 Tax=Gigaspora margarita TaxID=4874 RepID=A0A8H3WYE2_GIGMA|nr:hypothetical protein F8M41_012937 [Gigaspora margarita]